MLVKNNDGREIEIHVYGNHSDDIQIDEAFYLDSNDDVTDEDIEYIMDYYADDIYLQWYENKCGQAEAYYEGDR